MKRILFWFILLSLLIKVCKCLTDIDLIKQQLDEQNVNYRNLSDTIIIYSSSGMINLTLENMIIKTQLFYYPPDNLQNEISGLTFYNITLKNVLINYLVFDATRQYNDYSTVFVYLFFHNVTHRGYQLFSFYKGKDVEFINAELTDNQLFGFVTLIDCDYVVIVHQQVDWTTIRNLQSSYIILSRVNKFQFYSSSLGAIGQNRDNLKSLNNQENEKDINFIESQNGTIEMIFASIIANFEGKNMRFLYQNIVTAQKITVNNSIFQNMRSQDSGGCFHLIRIQQFNITNTTFDSCYSGKFGGALFVREISYSESVVIKNSQALFAGGSFTTARPCFISENNIKYINNTAMLPSPENYQGAQQDYDQKATKSKIFELDSLYEFNQQFQNTPYYMIKLELYTSIYYPFPQSCSLNEGQYYIMRFKIDFKYYNERYYLRDFNESQYMGNLYNLLSPQMQFYFLPNQVGGLSYPYLVFQFNSYNQNGTSNFWMYQFEYFLNDQCSWNDQRGSFNQSSNCQPGMMKVQNIVMQCQYCGYGQNLDQYSQDCVTCNTTIYDQCYANFSTLNKNFWRKEGAQINNGQYCYLNKQSCNGNNRKGFGNELCQEGYIGEQCLTCDIRGEFWIGESYGGQGLFQCVKCSSLIHNDLIIYSSSIFLLFLFIFTICSSYTRMKNQILRKYLSKLNIIYIGTSFIKQNQASIYIKILLFNFQMYILTYYFVDFNKYDSSFQSTIYSLFNPLQSQGSSSYDCFLNNFFPNAKSLGKIKIQFSLFLPLILNSLFVLIIFIMSTWKRKNYYFILIHSITYSLVFIFQSSTIQYSIESLKCLTLTPDDEFLLLDLSINCKDLTWEDQFLPICLLIVYVYSVPVILFAIIFIQRKKLDSLKMIKYFGFIYDEYKRKYYYWQFIKIGLTIVLSSLLTLEKTSMISSIQVYCGILCIYGFLLAILRPFEQRNLNILEIQSIAVSILYLIASISLQQVYSNEDTYDSSKLSIVIANIFYYCVFVGQVLFYGQMTILILSSIFQISMIKLQRFRVFQKLQQEFPNILSKVYSNKLRLNYKRLRQQVKINNPYYLIFQNQIEESEFNLINERPTLVLQL